MGALRASFDDVRFARVLERLYFLAMVMIPYFVLTPLYFELTPLLAPGIWAGRWRNSCRWRYRTALVWSSGSRALIYGSGRWAASRFGYIILVLYKPPFHSLGRGRAEGTVGAPSNISGLGPGVVRVPLERVETLFVDPWGLPIFRVVMPLRSFVFV